MIAWYELSVRAWPAMARTHLTLVGTLDAMALAAVQSVIAEALGSGHEFSLDLTGVTAIDREIRDLLLARDALLAA
jgi:ABC-type transporter Mla MlaB component